MLFEPFKSAALRLLKAPSEPPEPPAGTYASVQVFRASPRYLTYRLLVLGIVLALAFALAGALAIGALAAREPGPLAAGALVLALAAAIALPLYVGIRIDYELRYYVLTDRSLRVREGAWIVREITLTHANVQNLKVRQGPLQRLFGISSLEVETAGGGSGRSEEGSAQRSLHKVEVAGIENAREIRDTILGYLRTEAGSGLGDPDDRGDRGDLGNGGARAGGADGGSPRRAARPALPADAPTLALLREVRAAATALREAADGNG